MPEPLRSLPSNLQHFNRLLTEYSKVEGGMPVTRARHAIGVVVICSIVDRVRTGDGGHLFVTKGGSAMQMRLGLTARATTDLDFLFRGGATQWLDHLDEALLRVRGIVSMSIARTSQQRSMFPVSGTSHGG